MSKMYIKNGDESWVELTEEQQSRAATLNLILIVLGAIALAIWLLVS